MADRKGMRWTPPVDVPAAKGRADSGDLELDLVELFTDVAALAGDLGVGIALFVDEMQDIATPELAALCGACHEISQQGAPLLVVGAGLPHLPVALAASKSYAERLFRYVSVDRLPREMADRAWRLPAAEEGVDYDDDALDELYRLTDGYPYFVQAYGKVTWDAAVDSPIRVTDVHVAAPEAEAELAVGFFGARYDRATPAERDYMTAMADLGADARRRRRSRPPTWPAPGAQAPVAVAGARRADQEGPGLLRRAGERGVHRAALRQVPALSLMRCPGVRAAGGDTPRPSRPGGQVGRVEQTLVQRHGRRKAVAMPRSTSARVAPGRVLLVSCAGAFLAFLDATIVNIAFPSIVESFPGTSVGDLSWVLNAYNIVFAAFLIVFGRLTDLVGRRRAFVSRSAGVHRGFGAVRAGAVGRAAGGRAGAPGARRGACSCRRRWPW